MAGVPQVRVPQVRMLMARNETIGMGFNSDSGLAIGTPFRSEEIVVEADPRAPGQQVVSQITLINTHDELMESMGMSVEAQGRYGFFSAAVKAQFAESSSYNSTSTFLLAKVIVQNPFKRGRGFRLTQDADDLLHQGTDGSDKFKRAFGDSFVRGEQTGGEFYAVVRITSISTAKQTELAAHLEAEYNGLVVAGSFKAAFGQANASASTRSEFSAMMYQRAGTGEEISPTLDVSEVLARVKRFPTIVAAHPVAYEVEVVTYDTLPLPVPPPEEQESFLAALQEAREKRLRYIETKNNLEFARTHPEFFEGLPSDETLHGAIIVYTKLINAVMAHGIELSTGRMKPPRLFDPSTLTPALAEPAPIPLKRATSATQGTVRVPDLVAVDGSDIGLLLFCLEQGGTLKSCLDGTAFPEELGDVPIPLSREVAEFLNQSVQGPLRITWTPDGPDLLFQHLEGDQVLNVVSQTPPAGVEIPLDAEVKVELAVTNPG